MIISALLATLCTHPVCQDLLFSGSLLLHPQGSHRASLQLRTMLQVREQVRLRNFDALAEHDELVQAREAGDAFQGWFEGALTFPPTYKFRCVRDTVCTMSTAPSP